MDVIDFEDPRQKYCENQIPQELRVIYYKLEMFRYFRYS